MEEEEEASRDQYWFTIWFGVTEFLGGLLVTLMAIWLNHFRDGFTWRSHPQTEFNWHPLLMTVGMLILYSNAILIYRTYRNKRKKTLKIFHALINVVAFVVIVIGLQAVFDSHNLADPPIGNMYSLHSWLGLVAVIAFAAQWVCGFVAFLLPVLSAPSKAAYLPLHVNFGREVFALACIVALLGLTEKAFFSLPNYSHLPGEGVLINFIGLVIVLFMCCVMYLVSMDRFKRQPLPEDEMLLTPQQSSSYMKTQPILPQDQPPPHHHHYSAAPQPTQSMEMYNYLSSRRTVRDMPDPIIKLKSFNSRFLDFF